jgi:apolipoprotein N-acyltransferase
LNFDAYSFPDVGGWIVIGAGALAFTVWFFEWYKQRKEKRKASSKKIMLAVPALLIAICPSFLLPLNPSLSNTARIIAISVKWGSWIPNLEVKVITKKKQGVQIR